MFFGLGSQRMKYSNFAKISRLFQTSILYKDVFFFFAIYCFNKHHLSHFTGSGLGLINLRWNNSNEVAVTDPIVRNYYIAKKKSELFRTTFLSMFCFCSHQCVLLKNNFSLSWWELQSIFETLWHLMKFTALILILMTILN